MIQGILINISIHAPVKGATMDIDYDFVINVDFNPRTREGCDTPLGEAYLIPFRFQSTHP